MIGKLGRRGGEGRGEEHRGDDQSGCVGVADSLCPDGLAYEKGSVAIGAPLV